MGLPLVESVIVCMEEQGQWIHDLSHNRRYFDAEVQKHLQLLSERSREGCISSLHFKTKNLMHRYISFFEEVLYP